MKPKFLPVLEMCIENGLQRGFYRAYKHNDSPTEEQIRNQCLDNVMEEIYEWFDMEVNDAHD